MLCQFHMIWWWCGLVCGMSVQDSLKISGSLNSSLPTGLGAAVSDTPKVTQQMLTRDNWNKTQNAKMGCGDKNPVHDLDLLKAGPASQHSAH